ncbi:MAG TPA: PP2C family protein-serine/threonine phosphatase, partial [Candidatus Brocadiia bacterium]|nr:PP2C family protein-serine/threonine phosphatase [Candidatus Brocadiia bacterium]
GTALKRVAGRWRNARSLFRAAPALAVAAGLAAVAVFACGALAAPGWGWWALALAWAAATGAGVFALVETLGSLEQDNENQRREMAWSNRLLGDAYERIQRDVDRARRIQQALLPPEHYQPFAQRARMAFCYRPESAVGGDHFDYRPLDDRRLAVLLADVSGHGMSAAFVTGLVKTTFEMCGQDALSPAKFMARLNDVLCRFTPADSFATAVYVVYDTQERRLRYANAGHSPRPVVARAGGGAQVLEEPAGLPAGIEEGLTYEEGEVALGVGDCLSLATDGVSEAMDPQERALGAPAYYEAAGRAAGQGARALCDAVCAAVRAHEAGGPPHDDQTVLAMEALA